LQAPSDESSSLALRVEAFANGNECTRARPLRPSAVASHRRSLPFGSTRAPILVPVVFTACALGACRDPPAKRLGRRRDANQEQRVGARGRDGLYQAREGSIPLLTQRHLRCVEKGLHVITGIADKCADHARHGARGTTEYCPVDDEAFDRKRHGARGEVHAGPAASSRPRERTAVDVADRVVHVLGSDDAGDAAPAYLIMVVVAGCSRCRSEREQYGQQLSHTSLLSLVPVALTGPVTGGRV